MLTVILLAQQQPWLGLKLAPTDGANGASVRSTKGPAAKLPVGTLITHVGCPDDRVELVPLDLTVEPDGTMGSFARYREFLERQDRLAAIQGSEEILFTSETGQAYVVRPILSGRPLSDLPVDFWVQCFVGLIAWLVSTAVFVFRPGESSARYLLLSGASTLLFAPSAAIYTTRELAVPAGLFQWACDLNFLGGSLFAASFVGLLLVYPRRIAPAWAGPSVVALFVAWFVAQQIGVFESMTFARRFLVMVGVVATFTLAGWHWRISREDPLARAKLQWFLLSWVTGTSVFALFILLPQTFGVDTSPIQGYAFTLFLLVYGGLAMGILRYRLFELGDWWRRVIGWAVVVLFLVVLDLFFLYNLGLSSGTSLAVALLICGIVWLPLRAWIWQRMAGQEAYYAPDLFRRVVDVVLAPPGEVSKETRWHEVMRSVFEPMEIETATINPNDKVLIENDGLAMTLPPIAYLPGLRMAYARGGHGLFNPRDAALAGELIAMVQHAFESLAAYKKGVSEERIRIARDMHDNIGAQLLSALHSPDIELKDLRIRESMSDLREVINHSSGASGSISETLAELRIETADRLEAAGMQLEWTDSTPATLASSSALCHALRSIIREAVSNAIRHAEASQAAISLSFESGQLQFEVRDNGRGLQTQSNSGGQGLQNMRQRLEALNGSFELKSLKTGTCLSAGIPVNVK
jgi:signal transduction histidine kinase